MAHVIILAGSPTHYVADRPAPAACELAALAALAAHVGAAHEPVRDGEHARSLVWADAWACARCDALAGDWAGAHESTHVLAHEPRLCPTC